MKYTGRIVSTFGMGSPVIIWAIRHYFKYGDFDFFHTLFIVAYGIIGWWLGKQYDKAKFYSEKDVLTEVYNRRFVLNIFPKLLAKVDKDSEKLSLFVIDIDDFKVINDTRGHEFGDLVLEKISNTLMNTTRNMDLVARWGGDEFIIIAPYLDQSNIRLITTRLEEGLNNLSEKLQTNITISIGTAIYPDDAKRLDELIKVADNNMYRIKLSKKV